MGGSTYILSKKKRFGLSTLTVYIQLNGIYSVFDGQQKLCDLIPELGDTGLIWTTADLISEEYVLQIGDTIESHDM